MPNYNPQKHHRRSIRLQGYDYSQEGLYFITICCQDRAHLFGKVVSGEMILNSYGEIAQKEWRNTSAIRDNVLLHEFVVMPNHFHSIIEIKFQKGNNEIGKFQSPSQTVGAIIRGYKIATIKKIKDYILNIGEKSSGRTSEKINSTGELQFAPIAPTEKIKELDFKIWQRNYYEHIIRSEQAYERISDYIRNNPKRWNDDKFY
ncbi:transposase [Paenimyroides aestuarii]|uniref:Transposase IS200-like domain-containing protein n=1 Tax=Paenimyroides aestuarii TaxID=2968490 RepID=A0ABY5NQV6_9FLAO|nr:transposase [Paenimyroides aestuarii]UUV20891.1 hypothetical protein NPX36_11255 [Paenimyroides aestuarii]